MKEVKWGSVFKSKMRIRRTCLWASKQRSQLYGTIQSLVTVCCNVLLQGVVSWVSHYSITITHTPTPRRKNTHITSVDELSRCWACVIGASYKPVLFSFLFFLTCEGEAAVHYSDETLGPQPGVQITAHMGWKYGRLFLSAGRGAERERITEATLVFRLQPKKKTSNVMN